MEAILTPIANTKNLQAEVRLTEAVNFARDVNNITLAKAETTIHTLVKDHWLASTKHNDDSISISLGVRAMLELKGWLEDVYNLTECVMCSEPVVKGQSCRNDKCEVRMHNHCAQRWFQGKNIKKCPTCTQDWNPR
jgi:hypothetical protein